MTDRDHVEMAGARLAVRVAELIRLAMKASGLSQRELADRLGVGEARVSQIVNGDGNLRLASIARVFAALGYEAELKVYGGDHQELRITPRSARRKARGTHFSLAFETNDGQLQKIESYAPRRIAGRPVDFPFELPDERQVSRRMSFDFEDARA
jgi:transcriptional regulator with XRE-family HTH domain